MSKTMSLAEWCEAGQLTWRDLAERAGLDEKRARAIVEGRWLPSPQDREKIAQALGVERDSIVWGHKNEVAHIQGHGPQFGRSP